MPELKKPDSDEICPLALTWYMGMSEFANLEL